jgi:hypothetical protein
MLLFVTLGLAACGSSSGSQPNFTILASPSSLTVTQGNSVTSTIAANGENGFGGSVAFLASGLPAGVTASFNPASTCSACSPSTLTLTASSSATTGPATVTLIGTSGSLTQTTTISITIEATPNFTLSASPNSVSVTQGSSNISTITVNPANGFTGNVNLAVTSPLPSGVTASFVPNPAASSSMMTLAASNLAVAGGPVTLTITGTSGSLTQTTTISLTVTAAPNFTLSSSPSSLSVAQTSSNTSTIAINPANGFTGNVNLAVTSALPAGVTASFNPDPATSNSTLTFSASSSATTGPAAVIVTGTSGSLTQTTTLNLTVATIVVSISPTAAAVAATTQTQQFTAAVTGNTTNFNVNWSVDGIPGGTAATGTISTSGLYTPPSTGGTHTVTATSAADSSYSASATVAVTDLAGVFTHHNDLSRDGVNSQEYALTPGNVSTTTFGKLFSCATATTAEAQAGQGAVFTQPLWVPGLNIAGGIHNVIFVATQHDTVFAFDADANPCVTYWQVNLLDTLHGGTSGETPVFWDDVGCQCGVGDIYPEVGVTGTPVIDPATNTIYLVSTSQDTSLGTFYQRLHALDLASGNEKLSAPELIQASIPGSGDGGGTVEFNPQMENQRPALTVAGGIVYIGWSAHEDANPWHGWLIGYNAANVQQQVAIFNTTPNNQAGGIWAGGGGAAVDNNGYIYVATGNGMYDATLSGTDFFDYGDSVLKLQPVTGTDVTPNGQNLNLVDWFTPDDQVCLTNSDTDLGAGEPVLLPTQSSGVELLLEMGKEGVVYLINANSMGMLQENNQCQGNNSQIVQTFTGSSSGFYGTPAFWQNGLYFAGSLDNRGSGDYLKMFSFDPSTGLFDTSPASQSSHYYYFPGATPSISSQGSSNGIVWAIDASAYGYANPDAGNPPGSINCFQTPVPSQCAGPAVLHAYDATSLANEFWNSSMAANNRDQAGNAVKFVPPTIANGKVYVSTRSEVDIYGLLP